jgi:signal transduction histidine kinase
VIWGIFGGVATIYGPVAAVFILYPLTEWLGSWGQFGELRLLAFAIIVLAVLLFMPRGLAPSLRKAIETPCARCKQRNARWRSTCRLCEAPMSKALDLRPPAATADDAHAVELDQSKVRLIIVPLIALWLLAAALWDGIVERSDLVPVVLVGVVFALGVAHWRWILARPGVNALRRCSVVWLDMGAVTAVMLLTAEPGVMLYGLYPWIVIGNGFRYGRWYLHYAQAVALAGFALVFALNPYWREQPMLWASLFLVTVAVPWYVSQLLKRLHAARAEAVAANIAKTKFLAAASHDLRQPMQALSMYASILEERGSDGGGQRVVHGIQLSVKTLEQLFDSVLDISKIESGVIKPAVRAFALAPLLERVVEAERPMAALRNLDLRVVQTRVSVRSDPVLLERMLKNLVTNAIRYTERGGIVVGCRRAPGERVRLEVVDTGIGIPTNEQERIFDEYYQLGGASAQGLGLGLPIVRSLGALLGHAVTVRSALGRGSVFSIELERTADAPALDAPRAPPPLALDGTRVVLVDDDVEIRDSMQLLLESWGCRLIGGATVLEVEHKLQAQRIRPDAVIADYRLADAMTGLQAIERLRTLYGKHLPALVITGTPGASLLQTRATGVPVVTKPVSPGKLRAFLTQAAMADGPG